MIGLFQELPDITKEIKEANRIIASIEKDIKYFKDIGVTLTRTQRKLMYSKISELLDCVGELSIPIFNARQSIEDHFDGKYKHSPALGKQLWLKKYTKLHKPLDALKNKCWNILDSMDPKNEFEYEEI